MPQPWLADRLCGASLIQSAPVWSIPSAQPGDNVTGFMRVRIQFEREMAGTPHSDRAPRKAGGGPLETPANPAGIAQFGAIQGAAQSLGVDVSPVNMPRRRRDRTRSCGLRPLREWRPDCDRERVGVSSSRSHHRSCGRATSCPRSIPNRYMVIDGGLISYGPDAIEQYRRSAEYVDRILKGEKPAALPVQAPTKFELADQSQDHQSTGSHNCASATRSRRRGDRISFVRCPLLALSGHRLVRCTCLLLTQSGHRGGP